MGLEAVARRRLLLSCIAGLLMLSVGHSSPLEQQRRAYTVDDLLKVEGIGSVKFSPNGGSVVLEYLPPYDERGQYGIDRGGRLLKIGLSGELEPTPLFKHKGGTKYWMGDASPDGRYLVVFLANSATIGIAVYDFESNELTTLNEIPQVNERFELNSPIWINDRELVFSTRAEAWSQYGIRLRPYLADRTSVLRDNAFAGESSVASMSTSPSDHWYDGALIRYDVESKEHSVLARGRFGSFALSTNGTTLAALRLGQRRMHFPTKQLSDFYRFDTQLYVFDFESGSSQALLPNTHVLMGSLRWSSTGSRLSYFAWDVMSKMDKGTHHVLDSGAITPILVEDFSPSWVHLVPSGAQRVPVAAEWMQDSLIIYGSLGPVDSQQMDQDTSDTNKAKSQRPKWYAVEEGTSSVRPVISGPEDSRNVRRLRDGRLLLQSDEAIFVVSDTEAPELVNIPNHRVAQILNGKPGDEIGDTIAFTTINKGESQFGFVGLTQSERSEATVEVASRVVAWAPQSRQIVSRADTQDGGVLYLQNSRTAPLAIFTFNEHVSEIEHPRWDTINYVGSDGMPTFSCVLLPFNYNPDESYPTIVDVYPGTGKGCQSEARIARQSLGAKSPIRDWNAILAANGYMVVRPSNTYELNQIGGTVFAGLQAQVDAALNALIETGMTDPTRIGLWGFSNGSMASLWLASVSNRYKAVVPMFGGSSPHIEYFGGASAPAFQSYIGRPVIHLVKYESERGAMPLSMGASAVTDPQAYIKASPLDRARYICSPIMMVHSDFDGFSPYHYEALFSAMYRLGRHAELVRYYGEGHGLRSPGNIRDFYMRVLSFFETHVASGEPTAPC